MRWLVRRRSTLFRSPWSDVLALVAEHARERPVFLRHLLQDDVQMGGLGARMLDHGVGDGTHQRLFLRRRAACPHLNGDDRHDGSPYAVLNCVGWTKAPGTAPSLPSPASGGGKGG